MRYRLAAAAEKTTYKPRETVVYKRPSTGEVVETKSKSPKTLKAWKQELGSDTKQ